MKERMRLSGTALLLLMMSGLGLWAQESVIAKGSEELYGTWVNEKNLADVLHGQKVVVDADGMKIFSRASDPEPGMVVSWEIIGKWTDSEGNVWYKTRGTSIGGKYKGVNWQALEKVSKSGLVWERAMNLIEVGGFHPAFYPGKINPKGSYYRVMRRVKA